MSLSSPRFSGEGEGGREEEGGGRRRKEEGDGKRGGEKVGEEDWPPTEMLISSLFSGEGEGAGRDRKGKQEGRREGGGKGEGGERVTLKFVFLLLPVSLVLGLLKGLRLVGHLQAQGRGIA
jgi:hypothetical protein